VDDKRPSQSRHIDGAEERDLRAGLGEIGNAVVIRLDIAQIAEMMNCSIWCAMIHSSRIPMGSRAFAAAGEVTKLMNMEAMQTRSQSADTSSDAGDGARGQLKHPDNAQHRRRLREDGDRIDARRGGARGNRGGRGDAWRGGGGGERVDAVAEGVATIDAPWPAQRPHWLLCGGGADEPGRRLARSALPSREARPEPSSARLADLKQLALRGAAVHLGEVSCGAEVALFTFFHDPVSANGILSVAKKNTRRHKKNEKKLHFCFFFVFFGHGESGRK